MAIVKLLVHPWEPAGTTSRETKALGGEAADNGPIFSRANELHRFFLRDQKDSQTIASLGLTTLSKTRPPRLPCKHVANTSVNITVPR